MGLATHHLYLVRNENLHGDARNIKPSVDPSKRGPVGLSRSPTREAGIAHRKLERGD